MAAPITESSQPLAATIERGPIAPAQLLVMAIALILNMLDGFDVTAMAFTAPRIGEELAIPPEELGIVFSAALAGMMLGATLIAPVSDVIGRRKMILISILVIGISMVATGFVTELGELMPLRFVTGLAVGALLAGLATITAEYTPERYRGLTVVAVTAGYPLGATVGGFIAAPLLRDYGWQSVFIAGGIATLSMVVVVFFWLPESIQFLLRRRPDNALAKLNDVLRRLNSQPLESLPDTTDQEQPLEKANVLSLLTPERRLKTLLLWLTFFLCFISLYFLMSWVPKLVVNAGLSETYGVYGAALLNGGGVLGILTLGWLTTSGRLSQLIGIFLVITALGMLALAAAPDLLPLLPSLFVIGFFLNGGFCGLYAVAAKLYPTEIRSTGVGWAIGLGRFGAVVGPYIGGLLIATGASLELNFLIFAVPALLSGFLALTLRLD